METNSGWDIVFFLPGNFRQKVKKHGWGFLWFLFVFLAIFQIQGPKHTKCWKLRQFILNYSKIHHPLFDQLKKKAVKLLLNTALYPARLKIPRRTTGARGCYFLSSFNYFGLSRAISSYLGYLELSRTISDYLRLSRTILDYLRLSQTISDYLRLSGTIL